MTVTDDLSDPDDLLARYLRRTPEAGAAFQLDGEYHAQLQHARHLLRLADDAMDAEGIGGEVRGRVLRAILYGTPNPDDALARHDRREQDIARMMTDPGFYPRFPGTSR